MEESRALLAEINRARSNPQGCIEDIKLQLSRFKTSNVIETPKGERLRVIEGKSAWQDAILYLERCKVKEPMVWSEELATTCASYDSHKAKGEEVNPFNILKNKYEYQGNISFNINESEADQQLRELVITMIVGDGDEQKGNRTTLFNPSYKCFGGFSTKRDKQYITLMFFSDTKDFKLREEGKERVTQGSGSKEKEVGFLVTQPHSSSVNDLLELGKALFTQVNTIRKQPKTFIPALKSDLSKFIDDKTLQKGSLNIKTKEGKAPYDDLISQLDQQYPLPLLKYSEGLSIAAALHVLDLQAKNPGESLVCNNHVKRFSSNVEDINNIVMNRSQDENVVDMLLLLLVGDGDRKRGARRKVLGPVLKVAGMAVGERFFVINIGEKCKENKEEIEGFLREEEQRSKGGVGKEHREKEKVVAQESPPPKSKYEHPPNSHSPPQPQSQKLVKKKTTKTTTLQKGGKNYKITNVSIIYEDGTTEEVEEEEML